MGTESCNEFWSNYSIECRNLVTSRLVMVGAPPAFTHQLEGEIITENNTWRTNGIFHCTPFYQDNHVLVAFRTAFTLSHLAEFYYCNFLKKNNNWYNPYHNKRKILSNLFYPIACHCISLMPNSHASYTSSSIQFSN